MLYPLSYSRIFNYSALPSVLPEPQRAAMLPLVQGAAFRPGATLTRRLQRLRVGVDRVGSFRGPTSEHHRNRGRVPVLSGNAPGQDVGLHDAIADRVRLPTDRSANPATKIATIVAGMLAGADSIDNLDIARHGGMRSLSSACTRRRHSGRPAYVQPRARAQFAGSGPRHPDRPGPGGYPSFPARTD